MINLNIDIHPPSSSKLERVRRPSKFHPYHHSSASPSPPSSSLPPASKLPAPPASKLQAAESPSKLPASMPCQARCVESSSHPVIESWRFQDCKFLASNHQVIQSLWGSQDCKVLIAARLPSNRVPNPARPRAPASKLPALRSFHCQQHPSCQLPPSCRPQNHHPSCKPPCLQASRLDASNHRLIQSSNLGGSKIASF